MNEHDTEYGQAPQQINIERLREFSELPVRQFGFFRTERTPLAVEVEIHVWIHSHVIVKSTRSKGQIFEIFLFFISLSISPVYEWSPYLVLCFAGLKLSPVVFYGLCLLRTNKRKRNENGIPQPLFSLSLTERPFHLYILFPSPYQKKLERKREKGEKEGQNFHLLY